MARVDPFRLVASPRFFWFLLLSLVMLPLPACGFSIGRADPPVDPACPTSTTSANNIDQRYLSSITMQNATTGWGQTYTQKGGVPSGVPTAQQTLLHTTDGGCHWQIVHSWKYAMEPSPDFFPYFLSASLAFVFVNGHFFLTRDAGASWSSVTLPLAAGQEASPDQLFFLTDQFGWMSVSVSSGGNVQYADLLRTTDGGQSWTRLHSALPLSLAGTSRITSLSFRNQATGWITGENLPSASQPQEHHWIYVTRDGGTSWQEQLLPSPQGYSSVRLLALGRPHFFSARDGVLPAASTHFAPVGVCVFITHDGGQSWHSPPFFALEHYSDEVVDPHLLVGVMVPLPSFTSLTTGWVGSTVIYQTTDGGRSWRHFDYPLPLRYSDPGLQFISDRVAFALAYTGDAINFQAPSELYRTTDGGKTWTTLGYSIS